MTELEDIFLQAWHALARGYPEPIAQYRFHPTRKWRFDFAFPPFYVAVEIDGGQWQVHGGRHNSDGDREKLNAAAVAGWRVLRFSGSMLRDPAACVRTVIDALEYESS